MLIALRCIRCSRVFDPSPEAYLCPACGAGGDGDDPGVLDAVYDYARARAEWDAVAADGGRGLFRFAPLLPAGAPEAGLPAGGTPLVAAPRLAERLGLGALWLKDETRNPTRSLKDRATAVAVALAQRLGRRELFCASAGNAAISLAGFCAHAGLVAHVFVPARASATRLGWLERFGARVHRSRGDYDAAYEEAEAAGWASGWYSRNCAFNPFLVEGKKTAAFEVAEQLGGRAPDVVVAPVGDGCTLGALGKGFREMREIGRLDGLPTLLGVQAEGVQPVVRRFSGSAEDAEAPGETAAASIAVGRPRNALRLLGELRRSGGRMVAVPDAEMREAQGALAREAGIVAELTAAAGLAGLARAAADGALAGKTAVVVLTGGRTDDDS